MKSLCLAICLIVWMIFTLTLTFSVIGLLLFIPDASDYDDNIPSTWMKIGRELLEYVSK